MKPDPQPLIFAPRPESSTLALSRGGKVWQVSLRPWMLFGGIASIALVAVAGIGSAALFLMSDDVASAFKAREARTVSAYERRIADLRRELDRSISRENTDRRQVADQVDRVLLRQQEIETRFQRMEPLVSQARSVGLIPEQVPLPSQRPTSEDGALAAFGPAELKNAPSVFSGFDLRPGSDAKGWRGESSGRSPSSRVLDSAAIEDLGSRVDLIGDEQVQQLSVLAAAAEMRREEIAQILSDVGVGRSDTGEAMGGPFVPVAILNPFANEYERLAAALGDLRLLQDEAVSVPFGSPIANARASSNFGVRLDPFLKRPALHAGVDYPAPTGTPVMAAAAGKVVHASRRGGYGLMVEIRHPDGHVTRYAHLSSIAVERGESVDGGTQIGRVGSTGRSTGPHLHYEVHRGGKAIDPTDYLDAGARLQTLL